MTTDYELPIDYTKLSWQERKAVREQYKIQQAGKCAHCGTLLSEAPSKQMMRKDINFNLFPNNFFKHVEHLHHDHKTGMTIGVVHHWCNAVLWQYHGE